MDLQYCPLTERKQKYNIKHIYTYPQGSKLLQKQTSESSEYASLFISWFYTKTKM